MFDFSLYKCILHIYYNNFEHTHNTNGLELLKSIRCWYYYVKNILEKTHIVVNL